MFFEDEPEWMKKARTVPLRSSWESRQPPEQAKAKTPVEAQLRAIA